MQEGDRYAAKKDLYGDVGEVREDGVLPGAGRWSSDYTR